ncbi:MAG: acyl-CoA dehydrogenase family protein [Gammaproteobacteria bacterium]
MSALEEFRAEARAWLEEHCPPGARGPGETSSGGNKVPIRDADTKRWLEACAEVGYTVPNWPKEYGGAGLDKDEFLVLLDEMRRIRARAPLAGMGVTMIGPTLLEYGNEDQKQRHLPRIARGEIRWCQGYSEPGAGSDLASLRTRAEDKGDHFVVNGQKIWTSGAQYADWIFCLTRTDPDAPKHEGISFLLQPGVTVKPIRLISGTSPFCETFFDDAIAKKEDLVYELNRGWTVAKRLLQHERSGISRLASGGRERAVGRPLAEVARVYLGEESGHIAHASIRDGIVRQNINQRAFALTQRRTVEESEGAKTPGPATSIFKLYGANMRKNASELQMAIRGNAGLGWEGDGFTEEDLAATRTWLGGKAGSIAGGTNEVQLNIIAKRVLGLPD